MPVALEVRHLYRGPGWREKRRRILTRAGGRFGEMGKYLGGAKCERCGRLDRRRVWTFSAHRIVAIDGVLSAVIDGLWSSVNGDGQRWHSSVEHGKRHPMKLNGLDWRHARQVRTQIGVAHFNGVAGDDRDENLFAWCAWCHIFHDGRQHRQTRGKRKDLARPLLREETKPMATKVKLQRVRQGARKRTLVLSEPPFPEVGELMERDGEQWLVLQVAPLDVIVFSKPRSRHVPTRGGNGEIAGGAA